MIHRELLKAHRGEAEVVQRLNPVLLALHRLHLAQPVEQLGLVDQVLRGDTAPVQADPAEAVALDDIELLSEDQAESLLIASAGHRQGGLSDPRPPPH